jgi:hypothetical protein
MMMSMKDEAGVPRGEEKELILILIQALRFCRMTRLHRHTVLRTEPSSHCVTVEVPLEKKLVLEPVLYVTHAPLLGATAAAATSSLEWRVRAQGEGTVIIT